jgi:hypothetical protein
MKNTIFKKKCMDLFNEIMRIISYLCSQGSVPIITRHDPNPRGSLVCNDVAGHNACIPVVNYTNNTNMSAAISV